MTNPVNELLQLLVRFYRRFISPLKPPCCRFVPSCSEYALIALRERGVIVGLALTFWRLLRCNPFYHGPMFDPVPLKKPRGLETKREPIDEEI